MSVKSLKDDVVCWREEGLSYEEIRNRCNLIGIEISKTRIGRILSKRYDKKKMYTPSSISRDNLLPIKEFVKEAYLANAQKKATEILDEITEKFNEKITVAVLRWIRIDIGFDTANRRYGHSVRLANRPPRYSFCRLHLDLGTMFLTHCFTDESMVQTCVTGRIVYILKGDNSRRVQPRNKHPASIMIWGGISWEGPTPLAIIRRGTKVDSGVYQSILHNVYLEWARKAYGGKVVLVQDNARSHVSESTRGYMEKEGIETMEWPAESPDLNPVEMAWAHMKQWLQVNDKTGSLKELREGINEWWSTKLTKDHCRRLILRMQTQMEKVVELKGAPVYD